MALLNNLYIHVTDESVGRSVNITSRPVEKGLPITDNVKREPITLSLTGEIVKVGTTTAKSILSSIDTYHKKGKYVKFVGCNVLQNALITSFDTSNDNSIAGGYKFSMELTEVRIAKPAYVAKAAGKTKQVKTTDNSKKKRYYTVKKGDCLWNIAKKYYGNGAQYKKIYNANKDKIKNPNLIYPGQKFLIP